MNFICKSDSYTIESNSNTLSTMLSTKYSKDLRQFKLFEQQKFKYLQTKFKASWYYNNQFKPTHQYQNCNILRESKCKPNTTVKLLTTIQCLWKQQFR